MDQPASKTQIHSQQFFLLETFEGTGNMFVTTTIQRFLKSKIKRVLALASSTVAAELPDNGRTTNAPLKIQVSINPEDTCNIKPDSLHVHKLWEAHVTTQNKIVVTHGHNLEVGDLTISDISRPTIKFRGVALLGSEDIWQMLPVVQATNRLQIVDVRFKRSQLYNLFKRFHFHEKLKR